MFRYENGVLFWKKRLANCKQIGDKAGTIGAHRYIEVKIHKNQYKAHRIIYIMHYGDIPDGLVIDHINRIPSDNRIENLRLVTIQENGFNTSTKGYCWNKVNKKWLVYIMNNKKKIYLGYYNTEEEAKIVRKQAENEYYHIENRKTS